MVRKLMWITFLVLLLSPVEASRIMAQEPCATEANEELSDREWLERRFEQDRESIAALGEAFQRQDDLAAFRHLKQLFRCATTPSGEQVELRLRKVELLQKTRIDEKRARLELARGLLAAPIPSQKRKIYEEYVEVAEQEIAELQSEKMRLRDEALVYARKVIDELLGPVIESLIGAPGDEPRLSPFDEEEESNGR